ncbi:hypothetical protein ACA910_020901 [Epithemia clementina (nom. ined.)]
MASPADNKTTNSSSAVPTTMTNPPNVTQKNTTSFPSLMVFEEANVSNSSTNHPFVSQENTPFLSSLTDKVLDSVLDKPVTSVCGKRGCSATTSILKCANPSCNKSWCYICVCEVYTKYKLPTLVDSDAQPSNEEIPVCTKLCYKAVQKLVITGNDARIPWDKDGKDGENDPYNSSRILLDWITTEGNYARFRGSRNGSGVCKIAICNRIADIINSAGVRKKRTGRQVQAKIEHIEACFRVAYDFANRETGQGLKEDDPPGFKEAVTRKCPHYFELLDIFADRASACPRITSDATLSRQVGAPKADVEDVDDDDSTAIAVPVETLSVKYAKKLESDSDDEKQSVDLFREDIVALDEDKKMPPPLKNVTVQELVTPKKSSKTNAKNEYSSKVSCSSSKTDSKKSSSKKKKKNDGFNQDAWLESQKAATEHRKATLAELSRHNQVMEEAAKWEAKIKEMEYKKKLFEQYQLLKSNGWSDDNISAIIPEATRLFKHKKTKGSPKKATSIVLEKKDLLCYPQRIGALPWESVAHLQGRKIRVKKKLSTNNS